MYDRNERKFDGHEKKTKYTLFRKYRSQGRNKLTQKETV